MVHQAITAYGQIMLLSFDISRQARQLADDQAAALVAVGKAAFSTTHSVLLLTAAALIAGLAALVFFLLAGMHKGMARH
jgi:MFS transporter, DHA2 family, multidrug resistance protein